MGSSHIITLILTLFQERWTLLPTSHLRAGIILSRSHSSVVQLPPTGSCSDWLRRGWLLDRRLHYQSARHLRSDHRKYQLFLRIENLD